MTYSLSPDFGLGILVVLVELLAHDFTVFVLHQVALLQSAHSPLELSLEHLKNN